MYGTRPDGLIVTGTEPLTDDLRTEPYWGALAELIGWAEGATASALLSCLAAHAAALLFDGIERHTLAVKCSGVFVQAIRADHPAHRGARRPCAHASLAPQRPALGPFAGRRLLQSDRVARDDVDGCREGQGFVHLRPRPRPPGVLDRAASSASTGGISCVSSGASAAPSRRFRSATSTTRVTGFWRASRPGCAPSRMIPN